MPDLPIPTRLADRPIVAGLVVPFISISHSTGHVLGAVHTSKRDRCLRDNLCQTCGQQLDRRAVLFVRAQDVAARVAAPKLTLDEVAEGLEELTQHLRQERQPRPRQDHQAIDGPDPTTESANG